MKLGPPRTSRPDLGPFPSSTARRVADALADAGIDGYTAGNVNASGVTITLRKPEAERLVDIIRGAGR